MNQNIRNGVGILGAIIGAIAGGGLVGAIVGAGVGMGISFVLEKTNTLQKQSSEPPPWKEKDSNEATPLFRYLFMCLGKLAKADGCVSPDEAQFVSEFLKSMDFPSKIRKQLIACFNEGRDSQREFSWFASKLGLEMHSVKLKVRRETLVVFCSLAVVDEELNPAEEQMLKQLEQALEAYGTLNEFFAKDENAKYRQQQNSDGSNRTREEKTSSSSSSSSSGRRRSSSPSPLQSSYDILGVSPDATNTEVKKAFRKRVQEFHPDHVQGKGLSNDFIEFAKKRMQEINEAYDAVCKSRGM